MFQIYDDRLGELAKAFLDVLKPQISFNGPLQKDYHAHMTHKELSAINLYDQYEEIIAGPVSSATLIDEAQICAASLTRAGKLDELKDYAKNAFCTAFQGTGPSGEDVKKEVITALQARGAPDFANLFG